MRHRVMAIALVAVAAAAVLRAQQARPGLGAAQTVLNRTADAILGLKSARFSVKRLGAPAFPEGTFQSNPLTRQFGRVPAGSHFNGVLLFATTGIPEVLRIAVQKAKVVGKEKLENREVLHLTGGVSGEKLNPLIGGTLKAELLHSVDLWVEERTAHPVQLRVNEPEGNAWLIELSRIDEPVDIPTPRLSPPPAKP